MSCLLKDCSIKKINSNIDLDSRIIPMQANSLKNNMWCLDDKSGIPGKVFDLKKTKTGKYGHAKCTYKLKMPHSGRTSRCSHPSTDHLKRPQMEKIEYIVSHVED